jgi:predicted flap endonuclease-1-like 5' DNA nuclease
MPEDKKPPVLPPKDPKLELKVYSVRSLSQTLLAIEGIGPAFFERLRAIGVKNRRDLLVHGATPKGRKAIADGSGISSKQILEWVSHVDLYRINGVGSEYADLLEAAGVDTVPELAQRNPQNLHQRLLEINAEKRLVRRNPSLYQVRDWVDQARNLPRMITY